MLTYRTEAREVSLAARRRNRISKRKCVVDETPQSVSSRRLITRPRKANLFPEPLNTHKSLEIESYTILPYC
ncbi:hypothetical protein SAMN05421677_11547 [Halobacillus aidingensis]|uniref:Uncharacterized protein n=1 Tax=Halobacillus aidingensis TaxID=240303 RepID=A0A1H0RHC5_HALAD|nr:hypothetical protein SAMN05421677_11547 [Halobacillus aidingensis]